MTKFKLILPLLCFLLVILTIQSIHLIVEKKHTNNTTISIIINNKSNATNLLGTTHKGTIKSIDNTNYYTKYLYVGDTSKVDSIVINNSTGKSIYPKTILKNIELPALILNTTDTSITNKKMYEVQLQPTHNKSIIPYFSKFINWGGDVTFLQKVVLHPIVIVTLIIYFFFIFYKSKQPIIQLNTIEFQLNTYLIWLPFIAFIIIILYQNHYFFLQDDNYSQFTPVLLHGLDGWYTNGSIPTYNPLQYSGVATTEYSTYAFFYPITHTSYCMAKYLLGNKYYFNNVFTLTHFAVGYWYMYKLLQKLQVNTFLSCLAALSFIFCGYNIEASRSWYYVAPTFAFLPMLLYYIIKFKNSQLKHKQYFVAILLTSAFLYAGNFQYWVYTYCTIIPIYFFYNSQLSVLERLKTLVVIIGFSLLIFLPQLWHTMVITAGLNRQGGQGMGIWQGITTLILPVGGNDMMPNGWGSGMYRNSNYHFYKGGFLFVFVAFIYLVYNNIIPSKLKVIMLPSKFLKIVLFAFAIPLLLAIGKPGILWIGMSKLPIFQLFNHPFKWLLFVQFFGCISGAIVINYVLQFYNKKILFYSFIIVSMLLLTHHVYNTKDAFYIYTYNNPYQQLPYGKYLDTTHNYRVQPIAAARSMDSNFSQSLVMNFAMVHNIASLDGYEPLYNDEQNGFVNHRQLGVRYFIVSLHQPESEDFSYLYNKLDKFSNTNNLIRLYEDNKIIVLEDTLAQPLLQCYANTVKLNIVQNVVNLNNGVDFIIKNNAYITDSAILNYTYNNKLSVYVNGVVVPIAKDDYNRLVIHPNCVVKKIEMRYKVTIF